MRISDWSSDVCSSDLSGLASSWAAFTVHGSLNLQPGGRLGFVLPAELLHANYAAPVRRFLFENFAQVDLVLFEERVFAEAETEALLLLADGYGGSTDHARIRQVSSAAALRSEDQTSELQPLMSFSYAVICLKRKKHIPMNT